MKYLLIVCFLFIQLVAKSQDTIYYDEKWKVTKAKNYSFYRVKKDIDHGGYSVKDYFRNGTLQMEGHFSGDDIREGLFNYFYANGKLQSKGDYLHNKKNGEWVNYSDSGIIVNIGKYKLDQKEGEWKYYYRNGNLYETLFYKDDKRDGAFISYYNNQQKHAELLFESDSIVGNKTTYHPNGQLKRKEIYKEGNRVSGICYDSLGKEIPFIEYIVYPEYPGGEEALISFLTTHVKYPKKARRKSIEGRVLLYFEINTDGRLRNASVEHSVDPLLDAEAFRVLKSMPAWKPGMIDNLPAVLSFRLPVKFQLED
ncbi:MAG: TonB family protein [Bacteroidetes bacterium]|nr:TonB family protein [Bacteroidota bacterium]